MKAFNKVMKVLLAIAAIAGIIYVIAAYGERIVAWAKGLLTRLRGNVDDFYDEEFEDEFCIEDSDAEDFEA